MCLLFIAACTPIALFVSNLVYQVARKPSEVLAPLSSFLNKTPAETWRQYAPLFREYSTSMVSPAMLATLAQVESAGNPLATTYWRWRPRWNPFAIYQPASSAVGMYQMTDAAFAEARDYCIRNHAVLKDGCRFNWLYTRVVPSHAVELAAVFLDRSMRAILKHRRKSAASPQQKDKLAAMLHLCGGGPAKAFARRGFRRIGGERCGDHDVAAYLARVDAVKREFLRLAAGR